MKCKSKFSDKMLEYTVRIIRGVYPPTTMALSPPHSHVFPAPIFCPPKQFLDIVYAILCIFMRVFSEFWKLPVRDNDPSENEKKINGVGKAYCML